uniref:Secreted protein n=1 Tax=Syphacia muris TaxID=451379 RepID=A0A0N5AXD4_9BILA
MTSLQSITFMLLGFVSIQIVSPITLENVYKRLLEKERHTENSFSAQFIRPIGSVDGEFIWPRSYSRSSYLFFDENGAAYNIRPARPSLKNIIERTSFIGSVPATANQLS